MRMRRMLGALAVVLIACTAAGSSSALAGKAKEFTTQFDLQDCTFSTTGRNPYFILEPGHRLVLKGVEDKEEVEVWITVLPEKQEIILPGVGHIMTRVVEEREWVDGELDEVSRNFFAICAQTNDVLYFGEDVDNYENGEIANHNGGWRAGVDGATPGLIMPGRFLLGSRYFQEMAPGVALDRGENVAMGLTVDVPAGHFTNVVKVLDTTPLEPNSVGIKLYAPGVGLIVDETLKLVEVIDPSN